MKSTDFPKFRVFAEAPTVYQYNSVRMFGLTIRGRDGLLRYDYFDEEEDAINYLHECIDNYAATNGTEDEIAELREEADRGSVEFDAVRAYVQSAEYHSNDIDDVTWT